MNFCLLKFVKFVSKQYFLKTC
uniref:Uncharacterized protein n=1 Tax=Rhizophora mucronata TaxID=61149 RepID=A0A2P2PZ04_RHIMU